MRRLIGFGLVLTLWAAAPTARAQTPSGTEEVLRLVPSDMALCVVMQDLRGYTEKILQSPWYQALKKSPLGIALAESPEFRQLKKFEQELTKRLDTSWMQIRDDVLGDAVVFAFRQGSNPQDEHGLLLLKARDAALLARLIERMNQEQKNTGELKELVEVEHRGLKYVRRVERNSTHYYTVAGPIAAVSGKEEVIQQVLDLRTNQAKPAPVAEHLQRADGARAFLALWVNPRAFDTELQQKSGAIDQIEAHALKEFFGIWKALDAVVVTFRPGRELELSVSVLARAGTPEFERFFSHPNQSSDLWQRFPESALLTMTSRVDAPALAESVITMTPPPFRKIVTDSLQGSLGAVIGLDLFKDVLPNIGPDLGVCVLAAPDAQDFPQALAAIAVRPGDKQVDQALIRALQVFAGLGVLAYNSKHSAEPLQLLKLQQEQIEVHYLSQDKFFPRGVQPACALKDGYLVLATTPHAIKRFHKGAGFAPPAGEALCLRISFTEAAKLLGAQRTRILPLLAEKNRIDQDAAGRMLDHILSVVALFDRLTLTQRTGQGQVSLVLRLSPAKLAD